MALSGAGLTFDFATIRPGEVTSVEAFDLTGTGNNTIRLDRLDLLDLSGDTVGGFTRLTIHGNAGDIVDVLDGGWASVGTTTIGANAYTIYQNGTAQLIVDTDISFI